MHRQVFQQKYDNRGERLCNKGPIHLLLHTERPALNGLGRVAGPGGYLLACTDPYYDLTVQYLPMQVPIQVCVHTPPGAPRTQLPIPLRCLASSTQYRTLRYRVPTLEAAKPWSSPHRCHILIQQAVSKPCFYALLLVHAVFSMTWTQRILQVLGSELCSKVLYVKRFGETPRVCLTRNQISVLLLTSPPAQLNEVAVCGIATFPDPHFWCLSYQKPKSRANKLLEAGYNNIVCNTMLAYLVKSHIIKTNALPSSSYKWDVEDNSQLRKSQPF